MSEADEIGNYFVAILSQKSRKKVANIIYDNGEAESVKSKRKMKYVRSGRN